MSDFEEIQRASTGYRTRQALQLRQQPSRSPQVVDKRTSLAGQSLQREEGAQLSAQKPLQKKENNTGLPDKLKSGMENLSGYSLDHVKVHYNSSQPAAVQAHAYAQGSNIHLGSGQEKHLPHELGHVVQQMRLPWLESLLMIMQGLRMRLRLWGAGLLVGRDNAVFE